MTARTPSAPQPSGSDAAPPRLDVWLDVACLFRTRSEAQRACKGGKVEVNGAPARSNRPLRVGDVLTITRGAGRKQRVVVRGLASTHIAKAEARQLYEDVTPPPSPEEQAWRDLLRHTRPQPAKPGAPGRRHRRTLRQIKERGGV